MAITCVNPSIYHILPATSKTKISGSLKCNLSSNTYVNDPLSIRLSFPFAKVMRECGRLFFFTLKRLLYTIIMPECPLFTVKFAYCNNRNAALTKPVWTLYLSFAIHFSECTLVRVFLWTSFDAITPFIIHTASRTISPSVSFSFATKPIPGNFVHLIYALRFSMFISCFVCSAVV